MNSIKCSFKVEYLDTKSDRLWILTYYPVSKLKCQQICSYNYDLILKVVSSILTTGELVFPDSSDTSSDYTCSSV